MSQKIQPSSRSRAVGAVLRAVRKHRNESQLVVAEAAGINREELSMVETGRNKLRSAAMRSSVSAGFRVARTAVDALVDDDPLPVRLLAEAFAVPEQVIQSAIDAADASTAEAA